MNTEICKSGRRVLERYTAEDRIKFVEEYKASGQSQSAFCLVKGINPTTFSGWMSKEPKNTARFVEVSLPPVTQASARQNIEVKLIGGAQVNIPSDMNIEQVVDLIRRVTQC